MIKNIEIKDSTGVVVNEPKEVREQWRLYFGSLYDKDGKQKSDDLQVEEEADVEDDEKGPAVLKSEILAAIAEIKEGKAVGVDEVPSAMLKRLGDKALQEIVEICQRMYEEGKWPDDFTRVAMIPLPIKNNAAHFSDYRTISLICHASKFMLKVLTKRLEEKAQQLL